MMEVGLEKLEDDLRPLTAFVGTPFKEEAIYAGEKAFKLYDNFLWVAARFHYRRGS